MSNPNQQSAGTDPREIEEGEIVEMLSQDSGEETEAGETDNAGMREIVSALPAMRLRENFVDDNDDDDDEGKKTDIAAAAALLKAALTGKGKGTKEKERASGRGRRKPGALVIKEGGVGASGSGEAKPKRKAPELTNPPAGEPTCPYCNRKFASWKAAFGHQRAHKGREHRGFLPPPKFTPPSSPRRQPDDPAATAGASGSGAAAGARGRGLGIDLNAPAEEGGGSSTVAEFDLNKTPPKEDSEDEEKQA